MTAREEFTATLTTLRTREVMVSRPTGLSVRVFGKGEHGVLIPIVGSRVIGGRSTCHAVVLDDPSVSATHFEISLTAAGVVVLRDLGSKNGTSIHGVGVREVILEPGVRFCAGTVVLQLERVDENRTPVSVNDQLGELLGRGTAMGQLFATLSRLADTSFDVLLRGETGTGKELAARALHDRSARADGPLVIVDCTNIPTTLAESLLFGHRRGAYTGADCEAQGYFEDANGGTLVLDEMGELPLDLQAKLLRVLERREVVRVGESHPHPIDVRVIAATNSDLAKMLADGRLRRDLYHRLGAIEIEIPPLRDRGRANLEYLAHHYFEKVCAKFGGELVVSPAVHDCLDGHSWPGNVRELIRVVERAVFWADGETIEPHHLRLPEADVDDVDTASHALHDLVSLPFKKGKAEFEALVVRKVWADCEGNVSEASRRLEVDRRTLIKLLEQLNLRERS